MAGRSHVYGSLACPWAHRTLLVRQLKGLETLVVVSVVSWLMLESGSVAYGQASAYLPMVDLLKAYFKIDDRDDHRAIREKVTSKLFSLDESLKSGVGPVLAPRTQIMLALERLSNDVWSQNVAHRPTFFATTT